MMTAEKLDEADALQGQYGKSESINQSVCNEPLRPLEVMVNTQILVNWQPVCVLDKHFTNVSQEQETAAGMYVSHAIVSFDS